MPVAKTSPMLYLLKLHGPDPHPSRAELREDEVGLMRAPERLRLIIECEPTFRQVTAAGMLHGFLNTRPDLDPVDRALTLMADVVATARTRELQEIPA